MKAERHSVPPEDKDRIDNALSIASKKVQKRAITIGAVILVSIAASYLLSLNTHSKNSNRLTTDL